MWVNKWNVLVSSLKIDSNCSVCIKIYSNHLRLVNKTNLWHMVIAGCVHINSVEAYGSKRFNITPGSKTITAVYFKDITISHYKITILLYLRLLNFHYDCRDVFLFG